MACINKLNTPTKPIMLGKDTHGCNNQGRKQSVSPLWYKYYRSPETFTDAIAIMLKNLRC